MSEATISPELGTSTTGHALDAAEQNLRKVRSYAENHPLVAAGIAFAAGVLLSALVRR